MATGATGATGAFGREPVPELGRAKDRGDNDRTGRLDL